MFVWWSCTIYRSINGKTQTLTGCSLRSLITDGPVTLAWRRQEDRVEKNTTRQKQLLWTCVFLCWISSWRWYSPAPGVSKHCPLPMSLRRQEPKPCINDDFLLCAPGLPSTYTQPEWVYGGVAFFRHDLTLNILSLFTDKTEHNFFLTRII